jgi:hypothetical protein
MRTPTPDPRVLAARVLAAATPVAPANLRLEWEPYPHLRDDQGCVLARDHLDPGKVAYILRAVEVAKPAPVAPVKLRVEWEPYPHLRDDAGCVLANDMVKAEKVAFILHAVDIAKARAA